MYLLLATQDEMVALGALWIAGLFIGILIMFLVYRWIFKVNKTSAAQDTIIRLLKEIALKNGVEETRVAEIIDTYKKSA